MSAIETQVQRKPRRVLEEVLVPMLIVAPLPATITQHNCGESFGITRDEYLRYIGEGAFPVKEIGKLRVARYADVERYLTEKAEAKRRRRPPSKEKKQAPDPTSLIAGFDIKESLRKVAFQA
jgi:hypothetical protein